MRLLFTISIFCIFTMFTFSQCPNISYIQVDACNGTGSEQDNEFFMVNSGAGFNVNDFGYATPTGGTQGTVSSPNTNGFVATNPCPACFSGCSFTFVTNGGSVPAGQDVLVFTSSQLNFAYDFSGLCNGGSLYILIANRIPTQGQFANWNNAGAPNGCSGCTDIGTSDDRSLNLSVVGGCTTSATYNRCQLRNQMGSCINTGGDGASVVFNGSTPSYNNFGCAAPSLPVMFKLFLCKIIEKSNNISFSTASETNNDYFTIERSADGRSFDAIGEIKGAGNSAEEKHYEFTDENPLPGINYYRIKQTDYDGQYSYSEIRSVRHTRKGNVAISPRSTDGRLDISTEMESYDVAVYSSAGQEEARFVALSGHQTVNIESLQAGLYFVKVMSGTESETVRVVKY